MRQIKETSFSLSLQARIGNALDNKKNMWKELRNFSLLPGAENALHGFEPDKLNTHFTGVFVSSTEDLENVASILGETGHAGFAFRPVSLRDVKLAVKHFNSQACGEDGIPQNVILN